MMKKTIIITSIIVLLAIIAMIIISKLSGRKDLSILFTEVQYGDFEVVVTTTGSCRQRFQLISRDRRV